MTNEATRQTYGSATKDTLPFVLYAADVVSVAGVTVEQAKPFRARINAAYDIGEPVWAIADELKLRVAHTAIKPHKNPRELAARVVRV